MPNCMSANCSKRNSAPCSIVGMAADVTNSLDRALALLKLLEQHPGGLRNADLSRALTMPKSTCTYITQRLEREGFLTRDSSARYRLGLATVALAHGALRELGIRSVAEPALYRLTEATGLSAGIGVLERGQVLLVDRVEGPRFISEAVHQAETASKRAGRYRQREQRDIGRELPAHTTSLGKVLLAHLDAAEAREILTLHGMRRNTARTIVSVEQLLGQLAEIRRAGYALADEEDVSGLRALSVPILEGADTVRAAVSVNGPPGEPAWLDLPRLVRLVQTAARDIGRRARVKPRL